ncbi:MAG: hypothetical protein M3P26_12865, partial [Gemmatimonadota bacterium]|nr:hypothetical protein [Gemmatimonadota bacterium]
ITVNAVGGHGCQRDRKDGETVLGCGHRTCPDCAARELVAVLKRQSQSIVSAELQHWPDTPSEVKDNLLTGVRTGSF